MISKFLTLFIFILLLSQLSFGQKKINFKEIECYHGELYFKGKPLKTYEKIVFNKHRKVVNGKLFFKDKPLNGYYRINFYGYRTVISNFINGEKEGVTNYLWKRKLKETGLYKKNLREGLWKYYTFYGDIDLLVNYKNGLKEGEEISYLTNQKSNYAKGILNGWQYEYNIDGVIKNKSLYENGDNKKSFYYYFDGSLKKKCFFNNGKGACRKFQYINSIDSTRVIVDSIFYQNKKIIGFKSYINNVLNIKIEVKSKIDSTKFFNKINTSFLFYKQRREKPEKIYSFFYSEEYESNNLISFIINNSYKHYNLNSEYAFSSYVNECDLFEYISEYITPDIKFYSINNKSIYEYKYNENLRKCNFKLIKKYSKFPKLFASIEYYEN